MRVGERAVSLERPLSVHLGPGLLGQIYDGIQRPLREIKKTVGRLHRAGHQDRPASTRPGSGASSPVREGRVTRVAPGTILGTVQETQTTIMHRVLPAPTLAAAELAWIAPEGEYDRRRSPWRASPTARSVAWPTTGPRASPGRIPAKLRMDEPLITGQRVIDVFFPISRGGTAAIPGGFGTGKTMTQHALAKWCDADIIVYIGCGERGNEMTDVLTSFPKLIDPRSGAALMERTILIANTSNMPVAAREVSIYTGVTLAEYYRDMGYDVAIMADSTSRWAEALRELSGRLEEMPADEGFPAYLPTRLAEFYERAREA